MLDVQAVVIHEFGPPSVLRVEDVAEPAPGPTQVLIDVALANITFVDTQIRAGRAPRPEMLPRLPAILGNGVAGRVASVTGDGNGTLVGKTVISSLRGSGGYAERAVAEAAGLIDVPVELGLERSLALLADGRTALLLLRAAAVGRNETVLVEAAAGSVGSLLVQLAHDAGAYVIGAASGPSKLALARELGADITVDYTQSNWTDLVRSETAGRGADVVFDGVGGAIGRAALDVVATAGRVCAFGIASGSFVDISEAEARKRQITIVRGIQATSEQLRQAVLDVLDLACQGRVRPVIGQTFPLADAAKAHATIESRATLGKTLLIVR